MRNWTRKQAVNSLEVWTMSRVRDEANVQFEKMATDAGFHNAHVVARLEQKYRVARDAWEEAVHRAYKMGLVERDY